MVTIESIYQIHSKLIKGKNFCLYKLNYYEEVGNIMEVEFIITIEGERHKFEGVESSTNFNSAAEEFDNLVWLIEEEKTNEL